MNSTVRRVFYSSLTTGLTVVIASVAQAVPTFYTDRSTFQNATSSLTTESLDLAAAPAHPAFVTGTGITITGNGSEGFDMETNAEFISEGTSSLTVFGFSTNDTMTFQFSDSITAFGIDFLDDDTEFLLDLTVNSTTGNFTSNQEQTSIVNGPLFLGVIDSVPFTQVVILTNNEPDTVNFDFIQFGDRIPEPASAVLLALGGLPFLRRRCLRD